jgi:hypothetical protein
MVDLFLVINNRSKKLNTAILIEISQIQIFKV